MGFAVGWDKLAVRWVNFAVEGGKGGDWGRFAVGFVKVAVEGGKGGDFRKFAVGFVKLGVKFVFFCCFSNREGSVVGSVVPLASFFLSR